MNGTTLTRRGWSLLGAAAGLLVASRLLGTAELTTLGLTAVALLVGALAWTASRSAPVSLARTVRPSPVTVGGEARVDLEIEAHDSSPQLTVTDTFDDNRRAARFLTPALERGQRGRAAYRIPTDRRGRFAIGPAILGIADPFGLTTRALQIGEPDEIIVRPRLHELRPIPGAPGHRRARANRRTVVPVAAPAHDEFLALREYAVGDDLRRVHWRSSARIGDLMVREDESAWEPRTVLVFDNRLASHSGPSYEAAVEAVASIGVRLLRSGRACEILTTRGRVLGAGQAGGTSTEARLLDELATITADAATPIAPEIRALRAPGRRGLLVVVTGAPSDLPTFTAMAGPRAPIILVACASPPPGIGEVTVVDGRPGEFVAAWNRAAPQVARRPRRGAQSS